MSPDSISVNFEADVAVIVLRGDIDLTLDRQLHQLVNQVTCGPRDVVFDLSTADFVGVTAINAFLRAHARLGQLPGRVRIRSATPATERVLDAMRLSDLFVFEDGRRHSGVEGATPNMPECGRDESVVRRNLGSSRRRKLDRRCASWTGRGSKT